MIAENIKTVLENIDAACKKAGRNREDVSLICVSKTMPVSDLLEAYETGERLFGENKAQELNEKYPQMPQDTKWHFIGHLQRNKVKQVVDKAVLIHSVDSFHLAAEISKEAQKINKVMDILIEVNVAMEETKFGLNTEEVLSLVEEISALPNVHICGLMTIAPFVSDPEENRPVFRNLHQLSVDIAAKNIHNVSMDILSMGMTNDYQVAVEEGATLVRVGTAIFGKRNYQI